MHPSATSTFTRPRRSHLLQPLAAIHYVTLRVYLKLVL